jgi:hypothetical protein
VFIIVKVVGMLYGWCRTAVPVSPHSMEDEDRHPEAEYMPGPEGDTTWRATPASRRGRITAADRAALRKIGKELVSIERLIPPQVVQYMRRFNGPLCRQVGQQAGGGEP